MPLLPASLTEPLWVQFSALFNEDDHPEFAATHPRGCHRRRIPNRVVFNHVLAALVHGSGYERIATPGWFGSHDPPPTARLDPARRRCGTAQSRTRRLQPDERPRPRRPLIGWVDHQSPCGGKLSGRSPVDRGKQGTKRSVVTDGRGIPLAPVSAGANRHDSPLYEPLCARSRT